MKKETIIISGFMGFAIGVCSMMFVNIDKEVRYIEKINENVSENIDKTKFILQENIATCGDLIEWMNYDVERYADSTVFDSYILNLEQMIENNRNVLQTKYDN